MKTNSFQKYLEKRLNQQEIAEIKYQAQLEVAYLCSMQKMLADAENAIDDSERTRSKK